MSSIDWPELFFVRHGETRWNAERRFQGQRDIPINATGQRQADANGWKLHELLQREGTAPDSFDWFCSPMSRTRETMERIRAAFDTPLPPVIYDAGLVEMSFGILEGNLLTDIADGMQVEPGRRTAEYWHFRPKDGENYDDLTDRLKEFSEKLNGPAIIVSHGGVMRALRHLIGDASKQEAVNWRPPQDAIARFAKGRMTLYTA